MHDRAEVSLPHLDGLLEEWMREHGTVVLRTAFLLLRDGHLAEDAAQETFLRAYQTSSQWDGRGSARNWLITICCNVCRQQMRKAAWKRLTFREIRPEEVVSDSLPPETGLIGQSLYKEIQQLPYSYREVVVLFYYHELSVKEISHQLGEREGTIKSKLSRARSRLKGMLAKEDWEI